MQQIYNDATKIISRIIEDNLPHTAVENALRKHEFKDNIYMAAIGKAAWTMAEAAINFLEERVIRGVVITKYDHSKGPLPRMEIFEAGHPVSDENSIAATKQCIEMAMGLNESDELLLLISGGGSALFEKPHEEISLEDIQDINNQLLASGADIVEVNIIRKRFSTVKAGRFARIAEPASIFAIVLSDVLGDRLDSIASGPAVPDGSTVEDAMKIVSKYNLKLTDLQIRYLMQETPKEVSNTLTVTTGSVRTLCDSAVSITKALGYTPVVLTTTLNCEASEAGRFMAAIACDTQNGRNSFEKPTAIIAGGETVVTLRGKGKGGRNQELALSAAKGIDGLKNTLIFSLGSDGTDGPTDAAGGIVSGETVEKLRNKGIDIDNVLADNDSYNCLKAIDSLIITGPTGTNVNDVTVILCR